MPKFWVTFSFLASEKYISATDFIFTVLVFWVECIDNRLQAKATDFVDFGSNFGSDTQSQLIQFSCVSSRDEMA